MDLCVCSLYAFISCVLLTDYIVLGGSFRDVLTYLRTQPESHYPRFAIQCDAANPLAQPLTIFLPENGLRLRFDGADQRLRLVEILDFSKISLTYKGQDLVKHQEDRPGDGPTFKLIYGKLFGPTFDGERIPGPSSDVYVLSYPGVAFNFNIGTQTTDTDFVSILSHASTSAAVSMSIFNGGSWEDARKNLWTRPCPYPRSLATAHSQKADEIELAIIRGRGKIEFRRRTLKAWHLVLSKTTPHDLIMDIGPPEDICKKNDDRMAIHQKEAARKGLPDVTSGLLEPHLDTDQSSINTTTDLSDDRDDSKATDQASSEEYFYNYYRHGFSILMSRQLRTSPPLIPDQLSEDDCLIRTTSPWFVATKLMLHGNIPNAHDFNLYRRIRWVLDPAVIMTQNSKTITSETPFTTIRAKLDSVWGELFAEQDRIAGRPGKRHMVINRGWGDSPSSSMELLGGWEDAGDEYLSISGENKKPLAPINTDLWAYQGLIFEVLKNDAISVLTIF